MRSCDIAISSSLSPNFFDVMDQYFLGIADHFFLDKRNYEKFVREGDFSLPSIKRFSAEQSIPTYILIGRLQRDRCIRYYRYPGEKIKYVLKRRKTSTIEVGWVEREPCS